MRHTVKFVIDTHSFVDVITNSSSELFVLDTDKTIETIIEILTRMISDHKWLMEEFGRYSENLTFEKVFCKPYVYTRKMWEVACKQQYTDDHEQENNIGKIILESANDNSIPYELTEIITDVFNSNTYKY